MSYTTKISSLTVIPDGEPLFSEMATVVSLTDEGGGAIVEVCQSAISDLGKIAIEPNEWPFIRDAIDKMITACGELEK